MALWCNGSNDILEASVRHPSQLQELLQAAKKRLHAQEMFQDGQSALTMLRLCACETYTSVSSIAEECGLWIVPPVTYLGGWETHHVISPNMATLRRFIAEVKKIGRIELLSHSPREQLDVVHDLAAVPLHIFEGLTARQVRALVSAHEHGLLEIPARERLDRVAKREGLSRSTYGEHLRKAQQQLLRNSYPYLKLRDAGAGPH